jgi:hypothetical protein
VAAWRWNHPEEQKKNLFMSVVYADDTCVKMNHPKERKKKRIKNFKNDYFNKVEKII